MINPGFTIIGLWIVVMIITFFVPVVFALFKTDYDMTDFISYFSIMLVIFVVLFELVLCTTYVKFKINPEEYGYTRIEQEATEVSADEK